MKKVSMKETLMELVNMVAKQNENGVFEIHLGDYQEFFKSVMALEKFVVKKNKEDDSLRAIAYKTKKSLNIIELKIIDDEVEEVEAEKKAEKKATKPASSIKIKTQMLKDAGLKNHECSIEMIIPAKSVDVDFKNIWDNYIELVNKYIDEYGYLMNAKAESELEVSNNEQGDIVVKSVIAFPKIKGHSKDGYKNYKMSMVKAKKELKALA